MHASTIILLMSLPCLLIKEVAGDNDQSLISKMMSSFRNEPKQIHNPAGTPRESEDEEYSSDFLGTMLSGNGILSNRPNQKRHKEQEQQNKNTGSHGNLRDEEGNTDDDSGVEYYGNEKSTHQTHGFFTALRNSESGNSPNGKDNDPEGNFQVDHEEGDNRDQYWEDETSDELRVDDSSGLPFNGILAKGSEGNEENRDKDSSENERATVSSKGSTSTKSVFDVFGFSMGKWFEQSHETNTPENIHLEDNQYHGSSEESNADLSNQEKKEVEKEESTMEEHGEGGESEGEYDDSYYYSDEEYNEESEGLMELEGEEKHIHELSDSESESLYESGETSESESKEMKDFLNNTHMPNQRQTEVTVPNLTDAPQKPSTQPLALTTIAPDIKKPPMFENKCEAMLDIILIINSASVDASQNYTTLKCGLVKFVEAMSSPRYKDNIHMGLIQFTGAIQSSIPLTAEKGQLKAIIYDMPTYDAATRADIALVAMMNMFKSYGRRGVPKVAVLVTYRRSSNPSAVVHQAVRASEEGITMFSIGLTAGAGVGELLAIAASNVERFHILPNFDDFLDVVENKLPHDVCKVWSEMEHPKDRPHLTKETFTLKPTSPMPVTIPPPQSTRKPTTARPKPIVTYRPRWTTRGPRPVYPIWTPRPNLTTKATTTTVKATPAPKTTTRRPMVVITLKPIVTTKKPKPTPPVQRTPRPVVSTPKPSTTTEIRPYIDVCRGCKMLNGAGYNPHLEDCTRFIKCFFNGAGDAVSFQYEDCPFGLFWNQDILSCDHPVNVKCYNDLCRNSATVVYDYGYKSVCSAYWECTEFGAIARCCPDGYSYRFGFGCVIDTRCNVTCPLNQKTTPRKPDECSSRQIPEESRFYEQWVPGDIWMRMPCPAGTSYDVELCKCMNNGMISPEQEACEPEVILKFARDFTDESGKSVWVANENVEIIKGRARFDGKGRLLINRFTNDDLGSTLVIRFKYRSLSSDVNRSHRYAIMGNGDCGDIGSVVIYEDSDGVYFGVKTTHEKDTVLFRMNKPNTEWKTVEYVFNNGFLTAHINGNVYSMPSKGRIESRACALQIGHGYGFDNFIGEIDDFEVFKCLK